jgi:CheY-like chemotaxis protein
MNTQKNQVILLIEDDVFIEVVEKEMINRFGYEVITANSGEMAVEIALNNEKIALILMDINLGRGIDGPEAAEQILRKKNIPIVFIAAYAERKYENKLKEIPCYGCVFKASGEFVLRSSIEIALRLFKENIKFRSKMNWLHIRKEEYQNVFAAQSNALIFEALLDLVWARQPPFRSKKRSLKT